jgi:hypothetical protein
MKSEQFGIFLILLTCYSTLKLTHKNNDQMLLLTKGDLSGYYYIQKLQTGDDPLSIIQNSEQEMVLKYFNLNSKLLSYSPNQESISTIEGKIILNL